MTEEEQRGYNKIFEKDYMNDSRAPFHIGRIVVGNEMSRLLLMPDGTVKITMSDEQMKHILRHDKVTTFGEQR